MNKGDSDFLHQLFKENNELRVKIHSLNRELYNKSYLVENAEDEIRQLKTKLEVLDKDPSAPVTSQGTSEHTSRKPTKTVTSDGSGSAAAAIAKELEEALFAMERKQAEMKQMREEMSKYMMQIDDQKAVIEKMERESQDALEELRNLRSFRAQTIKEKELELAKKEKNSGAIISEKEERLQHQLDVSERTVNSLQKQIANLASDANRKHNEQQNQLQGVEALVNAIRREYDEFIQVSKLENDSFRAAQQSEYDNLKSAYEKHKMDQFEEKKRLMLEYQGLLFTIQTQFDEYRITAEYLFNVEVAKLEEEIGTQSARYQQEIMYIIQAKDKFYADMMVAKDAKIMSLIEGSDMQTLMQKHELDIENLRKEHNKEVERVKSDQESEQKNLISLLQRQNVSLESKCEKLQSHLKTLENKIRDLMGVIDAKNKGLSDKEDQRLRMEGEFMKRLEDAQDRINLITQEKEHLRHKVIRLNLDAKGEGANSIDNMVKRITRETGALRAEFEQISARYDSALNESQSISKRLKEKEKMVEFLEKEITKRNAEFQSMTKTFEEFLSSRARQARQERVKRLMKMREQNNNDSSIPSTFTVENRTVFKASIPAKSEKIIKSTGPLPTGVEATTEEKAREKTELERGYSYLRRFKTLSRAFATGDFRYIPVAKANDDQTTGAWQNNTLYSKLGDANQAIHRIYNEDQTTALIASEKPVVYDSGDPKSSAALHSALTRALTNKIGGGGGGNELKLYSPGDIVQKRSAGLGGARSAKSKAQDASKKQQV